jgi:hypothetical protein
LTQRCRAVIRKIQEEARVISTDPQIIISIPYEIAGPPADSMIDSLSRRNPRFTYFIIIAAFAVCSLTAAIKSEGFLETDGLTHFLFARHVFEQPQYLVDVWGRPLVTMLFALPARLGLIGVRITSLAVALGCGWIALKLAEGQGNRWPMLALVFTLGQPLLFLHSFSELTELPFALVLGGALLAYQRKQFGLMTALVAISPLARPEGFGFLILCLTGLVIHRRWWWIILLPMPLVAWSIAGHLLAGPADQPWWKWIIQHWPYESNSVYGAGAIYKFVAVLPMLVGPFAIPATCIGAIREFFGAPKIFSDHKARVGFLIATLPLGVLIVHSLLYWYGKMSSNGELRYLLIVAPMWGVLSAVGWEWVFSQFNWKQPIAWAALAAVVPGSVNYAWRVLPMDQSTEMFQASQIVDWYESAAAKQIRAQYPKVLTSHPGVSYYLDAIALRLPVTVYWSPGAIDDPPNGTILLWDPVYCTQNASADLVVQLDRVMQHGWINDWPAEWKSNVNNPPPWANYKISNPPPRPKDMSLENTPTLWHVFFSPRDIVGKPTEPIPKMPSN